VCLGLAAATAVLTGCAGSGSTWGQRAGRRPTIDQVAPDFRTLTGWVDDEHAEAMPAILRTCEWTDAQPADRTLGNRMAGTVAHWKPICTAARRVPAGDSEAARLFFEAQFHPVSMGSGEEGLFTGYYEPELHGSWQRTGRFTVPLYKMPPRGAHGLPPRARIIDGALAGRGLEILWVDNPIDAFFLEVQGSGRVSMSDGSVVRLSFAGQNGHGYYPIGRHLIDQGFATQDQMSMQFIRHWLNEHPQQARAVMNLNPSYVFFRVRQDEGPRGARNMVLTPGRSLAVDAEHIPLGAPLWLELREAPVPGGEIKRLVVAQDTGGAIRGTVRGDLFWGFGSTAENGAGIMKARGRYSLLVPRSVAPSLTTAQAP
jgi:membrane-bound lytic murein transglycosylase A